MSPISITSAFSAKDWVVAAVALCTVAAIVRVAISRSRTTKLRGPPSPNFLYGYNKLLHNANEEAVMKQETWSDEYGSVYQRPSAFGARVVVLTDPKAIAHFYAHGDTTYKIDPTRKKVRLRSIGPGILTSDGDDHKRQRRIMSSGFTNAKLREYTSEFFNSAYKLKAFWDREAGADGKLQLDVVPWMNAISLDSVGLAGFSHDFGSLRGQTSRVGSLLDSTSPGVPTPRTRLRDKIKSVCGELARGLLTQTKLSEGTEVDPKSILGLLIKAENSSTGTYMTEEEVNSQMRVLMLAGYETTATTMTWCLIELCKRPELQEALRKELRQAYPTSDPTWDELMQKLPLLDAVVHETLRLHPAVPETISVPGEDDVIPLGSSLVLADGTVTDKVHVAAGTRVAVPIRVVNRMRSLWGEDAGEFKPERWLNGGAGIPAAVKDIQGHRHLITFINGPRTCLGKGFAVAEFKAVMSVVIKHFAFELPQGPQTKINIDLALVPRPTVDGQPQCRVPMHVTRVE